MNNLIKMFIIIFLLIYSSNSKTINVPSDESTIQNALNIANSGDTIFVAPGIYKESLFWPTVNGIKLISEDGFYNTIIDCNNAEIGIYFSGQVKIDSQTIIHGLEITNASNTESNNGWGIDVYNSSPVIKNCLIKGNGGGIRLSANSNAIINHTIIKDNIKDNLAGIFIDNSAPIITNCKILNNRYGLYITSAMNGLIRNCIINENLLSGVYIDGFSKFNFINCYIINNYSRGFYIHYANPKIDSCVISGNEDEFGGSAIHMHGDSNPIISNSTIAFNLLKGHSLDISNPNSEDGSVEIVAYDNTPKPIFNYCNFVNNNYKSEIYDVGGISVYGSLPSIKNSNFISNKGYSMYSYGPAIINADSNYWGSSNGPYHPSLNPGGTHDTVNAYINPIPFLTEPDIEAPPIPVQNLKVLSSNKDSILLSWDSSLIRDLSGYKVCFKTDTSELFYTDSIDVGNVTFYSITNPIKNSEYYISVICYDIDGNESWYSNEVSESTNVTALQSNNEFSPIGLSLKQNYPNPFNPSTSISYTLNENVNVKLVIYNILGEEIKTLVDSKETKGSKQVVWHGTDNNEKNVASGIYIYKIVAGDFVQSRKMLLVR